MKKYLFFIVIALFVAGCFSPLYAFASDGPLDTSFVTGGGFTSTSDVRVIVRQSDGKILIGGAFTSYNGITANRIIRLNADGSIDGTFNVGVGISGGVSPGVYSILLQPDGKILIGGSFSVYGSDSTFMLVRLNADGSVDSSFTSLFSGISNVLAFALQPDGKIIVAGNFSAYDGTSANRIVRLNADGSRDTTFNMGTGFNSTSIDALALQPDGKVIVGGNFTAYNGTAVSNIVRLNTDGSIDGTFNNTGTGFSGTVLNGIVRTLALDDQDRVIADGDFTSYDGTPVDRIIRLNTDGSIDGTFTPSGTGFDNTSVRTIAIDADDKILFGGTFISFNGNTVNRIIRLNTDGSQDQTFNAGSGFNNTVNALVTDPDNNVLAGGLFTSYNGTTANAIVRLGFSTPVITFSANPTTTTYNGTSELTWSVASLYGGTCTASDGWSGNKASSGTEVTHSITGDTTFTLSCTGPGGTMQSSVIVTAQAQISGGGGELSGGGSIATSTSSFAVTTPVIPATTNAPTWSSVSGCTATTVFSPTTGMFCGNAPVAVPVVTTSSAEVTFNTNLKYGMVESDVDLLQHFLDTHGYPVEKTGAGSLGHETTKFGPATRAALEKYQNADDIKPAVGYFGPVTRAYVNAHE